MIRPVGVSPVLPLHPLQSLLTCGVNIFPSNDNHKYVDLPDKVSSALCGCGSVDLCVWGGQCMCVRVCVCVCVCVVCVCAAIVHV